MKTKHIIWVTSILGVLALGFISEAFAGTTGKIMGDVTDSDTGEPLVGVNVMVEGTDLGAATNEEGHYVILNIPPGTYDVTASYIGYQTKTITDVKVQIDLTTTLDFELSSQALSGEEVTVTAERDLVQKDRTSSEVRISSEEITETPVQEVNDLIETKAGVTKDAGGGIHIRGGRGSEVVYMVDGIPITDAYDRSTGVEVEKGSIQELQMVTGTFNAEYGQAMSGIINIVTKSGGRNLHGNITAYAGDYYSTDDLYFNLGNVRPVTNRNLQASLSGPIPFTANKLTFYSNARYFYSDGYLYGANYFSPQGAHVIDTLSTGSTQLTQYDAPWFEKDTLSDGEVEVFDTGVRDSSATPMNWEEKYSFQGKLTFKPTTNLSFDVNLLANRRDYQSYDHYYRLNPEGDVLQFDEGYTGTFSMTHTLSERTFYEIKGSAFLSEYQEYLYEDPLSPKYVHPDSSFVPQYSFAGPFTNPHHFQRQTVTYLGAFDITSQLGNRHELKSGLEYKSHELYLEDFNIVPARDSEGQIIEPFQPMIPEETSTAYHEYSHNPMEFAAYIQDKIEYPNMIINLGVRFDYFDSRGRKPVSSMNPNVYLPFNDTLYANGEAYNVDPDEVSLEERKEVWYEDVEPEYQVSPRLGIAFPITDRGVIHFSYGHFLQIPSFQYLYSNPGWKVSTSSGIQGPFGNPGLNSQKTVMYEIGLQQQLTNYLNFDITGYYRDIRDWVSVGPPKTTYLAGVSWTEYVNRDYANVRGVSVVVNRRIQNHIGFNIDYTLQIAEGTNSDPLAEYYALQNNESPVQNITPLNWDQRHTLNVSLLFGGPGWTLSLLGQYGSGYPYTPYINVATRSGRNVATQLPDNSRRKPDTYNLDMRASKNFDIGGNQLSLFLRVFNLLDLRNATNVYSDTGEPDYTTTAENVNPDPERNNTVREYLQNPTFYSAPREIQWGIEYNF